MFSSSKLSSFSFFFSTLRNCGLSIGSSSGYLRGLGTTDFAWLVKWKGLLSLGNANDLITLLLFLESYGEFLDVVIFWGLGNGDLLPILLSRTEFFDESI